MLRCVWISVPASICLPLLAILSISICLDQLLQRPCRTFRRLAVSERKRRMERTDAVMCQRWILAGPAEVPRSCQPVKEAEPTSQYSACL